MNEASCSVPCFDGAIFSVAWSLASLWAIQGAGANLGDHLLGLAVGAGIHIAILAHVKRQLAATEACPAQ